MENGRNKSFFEETLINQRYLKETLINSVREFVADFGCSPKPKNAGVAEATARLFGKGKRQKMHKGACHD